LRYLAFRAWLRLDRSPWWIVPAIASLCLFAFLLTLVDAEPAGRTYRSLLTAPRPN
jgi:small multidrug resistance family-3 protein